MERSRAAIAAIANNLKGEIAQLLHDAEEAADEAAEDLIAVRFRQATNDAVWEALYTLADEIDLLRAKRSVSEP